MSVRSFSADIATSSAAEVVSLGAGESSFRMTLSFPASPRWICRSWCSIATSLDRRITNRSIGSQRLVSYCWDLVARTLLPDRDEDVPVRVINGAKNPVVVKAGTIVSDIDPAQVCAAQNETTASAQGPGSILLGMVDNVDKSVSDEDRRRLVSLLTEFSTAFSKDENDLGWTDIITNAIDTGDSKPVRQPSRRHPPAHMVAIQEHVSNMLQQGVIQHANSPWASNLVLVKKKKDPSDAVWTTVSLIL